MPSEPAIRVEGLEKTFAIGRVSGYRSLRETIMGGFRRAAPAPLLAALDGVSFEVKPGEVLGVIGRNGAGKSTLLKVLSRITPPTKGRITIRGRVRALLEVGTGFHPELTGRENIFLNGAILGMKRREIAAKFDEIVAFSEIGAHIETPVKHYSSGMYVRLAFAVAAHLEPEVLLVDEVLAVGDAAFQKRCLGRMGEVARGGRTVLFVSHDMPAVLALCQRVLLLEDGKVARDGPPAEVIGAYLERVLAADKVSLADRTDRRGDGKLRFTSFALHGASGPAPSVASGEATTLAFRFRAAEPPRAVVVAIGVRGHMEEPLFHLWTSVTQNDFETLPREGEIRCRLPAIPLQPGRYTFNIFCTVAGEIADWVQNAGTIQVTPGDFFGSGRLPPADQGPVLVKHSWEVAPDQSRHAPG
jgi:lipopolysaccharide transport system ATP-binding protein